LASLLSDLSHETVTSVLPALLASMGVAAGALGTIEGVADGLSSLAKLYGGWWTDRLEKRKRFCAGGYAAMAAATGIIATATAWPVLLLGRAVAWISRGLRTPARKALLADAVTPENYGRAFGFERMMDTVGAVLAPLAVMAILQLGMTIRTVLWLAIIPAIAAAFAILLFVRERHHSPNPHAFWVNLRNLPPPFKRFLKVVGLFGSGDFAHSLIILYAVSALTPSRGAGSAAAVAAGLYALHNVCYAGVSYPIGALADRSNKYILLALGYACGAGTALLLMSNATSLVALGAIFALGGIYVGIEETLEDSLAAELLPHQLRGTGFGAMAMVNGIGDFISSIAVGWLWMAYGTTVGFAFAFTLMTVGSAFMWRIRYSTNRISN
jgi:MFS family permease